MSQRNTLYNYLKIKSHIPPTIEKNSHSSRKRPGSALSKTPTATAPKKALVNKDEGETINPIIISDDDDSNYTNCDSAPNLQVEISLSLQSKDNLTEAMTIKYESTLCTSQEKCTLLHLAPQASGEFFGSMTIKEESTPITSKEKPKLLNLSPQSNGKISEPNTINHDGTLTTPKRGSNSLNLTPQSNGDLSTPMTIKEESTLTRSALSKTPTATTPKKALVNAAEDETINPIIISNDDDSNYANCDSAPSLQEEISLSLQSKDNLTEAMTTKNESTLSTLQEKSTLFCLTPEASGELFGFNTIKEESTPLTSREKPKLLTLRPQSNGKISEPNTINHDGTLTTPKTGSKSLNLTPQSNGDLSKPTTIKEKSTLTTPKKNSTPTKSSQGIYFSPTKNRLVTNGNKKRSPAKKIVAQKLFKNEDISEDLDSSQDDMIDDKSLILLTNIKNMVKDTSLFNLLDEQSQNILKECLLLEYPVLHLVCRLYWRLHNWYRLKKLMNICKNKSIDSPALQLILHSLVEKGIMVQNCSQGVNSINFKELSEILNSKELKQVCKDLNIKMKSKQCAVKSLKKYCGQKSINSYFNVSSVITNNDRVMNKMREKAGTCYKLSDSAITALKKLYLLMYLGIQYNVIRDKKLEWIIIYDKIKKETFPIDKTMILDNASCVFNSRQEFESYVEAHSVYERFLAETAPTERCKIVETVYKYYQNIEDEDMERYMAYPEWLYKYTPPHIYIKILDKGVQDLKRQKEPESYLLALEILSTLIKQKSFKQQKVGDWYAEKALILHTHLRRHDEAAMLLIEGFESVDSDVVKETMQPRAIRISRQQNTFITEELREKLWVYATRESKLEKDLPAEFESKKPMDSDGKRGTKIKFIVQMDDGGKQYMNVEEYCIYHCTKDGGAFTHAEHWEGRIVKSIFYLLFWDIIYNKPRGVSGIFLTYYQRHPLDMYYESFYNNRKVLINDKLSKIAQYTEDKLLEDMKNTWLKRPDYELSDIDRKIGWENIRMVAACLGPEKVAIICKRLATNYGYSVNGFPDVTAWNSKTKKIKFLEVKSDSDKPSIKQIQWMHYLHNNGIDTGFFYVGANPNRNKSRASQIFEEFGDDDDDEL